MGGSALGTRSRPMKTHIAECGAVSECRSEDGSRDKRMTPKVEGQ
jgi:hypothetical protein